MSNDSAASLSTTGLQSNSPLHYTLYVMLFIISGFSGLIYESIWSHYLKLFLGHAAYAQILVLTLYMGGIGVGSWLASRFTLRISNLVIAYAIIEALLGGAAFLFHHLFVFSTDLAYNSIFPGLDSPTFILTLKWGLASLMIIPQCILLGATFPLLSGGIIRQFSFGKGRSLSLLYFANSIGAVAGVLTSGFFLIDKVGLPGTIMTAGCLNIFICITIVVLQKLNGTLAFSIKPAETQVAPKLEQTDNKQFRNILFACAAITGAASFIYEAAWLRMLSMVLGSSTHAFELMLSAFILGLALGGLWIRSRIDSLKEPIIFLGMVQIIMGFLAIITMLLYNESFVWMAELMAALTKTEQGYVLFNIGSHLIAILIMLPATFCAGMTLPLVTFLLMTRCDGESAIGRAYAMNTFGAIIGLAIAVHLLMPNIALKGTLFFGGLLDIVLGFAVFSLAAKGGFFRPLGVKVCTMLAACALIAGVTAEFDIKRMSYGVYRYGTQGWIGTISEVPFHKDGKTATIHLNLFKDNLSIKTNGKPDASIHMGDNYDPMPDEYTMTMLGALPIMLYPDAKNAAVVGLGSGMSSHVVLGSKNIEKVTTIEIEEAIVEGAKHFGHKVERVFNDERSEIVIEDAKTYFSTRNEKYDIIISEPSNPWVSGIASLYTTEFYKLIGNYLSDNGLFVQWFHMYELDLELLTSVLRAMNENFMDYDIYYGAHSDLVIVARKDGKIPGINPKGLTMGNIKKDLDFLGLGSVNALKAHYLANKIHIAALIADLDAPVNSDYYPYLDQHAVKQRFLGSITQELHDLRSYTVPVAELLSPNPDKFYLNQHFNNREQQIYRGIFYAAELSKFFSNPDFSFQKSLLSSNADWATTMNTLASVNLSDCTNRAAYNEWLASFMTVMNTVIPYLTPKDSIHIYTQLESRISHCAEKLPKNFMSFVYFYKALTERNLEYMYEISKYLLEIQDRNGVIPDSKRNRILLTSLYAGALANGKIEEAGKVSRKVDLVDKLDPQLTVLTAYLKQRLSKTNKNGK